jgi:hypothetical protein
MKFKFVMSAVVEAGSEEDALNKVANHIATVSRQFASDVANIAPEFGIEQVKDDAKAVDLTDKHTQANGPIELELDPKSSAGVALAAQKKAREAEVEVEKTRDAKANRSDAEIMAEHSANEQAALNSDDA